jgi:hypothetical protein
MTATNATLSMTSKWLHEPIPAQSAAVSMPLKGSRSILGNAHVTGFTGSTNRKVLKGVHDYD